MQGRSLAADRLRHEKALPAGEPDHRRGVELEQLEVGQLRSGGVGEHQAHPLGPGRIGRPLPQRRGAPGRDHGRAGPDQGPVVADDPHTASLPAPQRPGPHFLEHVHVRVLGCQRGELAHQPPARRAAAGVDHPPHRVAALEAQREMAEAVGVEVHPQLLEVVDPCRRLPDEDLGGGAAHQPAPRPLGVGQVQLEAVIRRQGRRQPPCAQ